MLLLPISIQQLGSTKLAPHAVRSHSRGSISHLLLWCLGALISTWCSLTAVCGHTGPSGSKDVNLRIIQISSAVQLLTIVFVKKLDQLPALLALPIYIAFLVSAVIMTFAILYRPLPCLGRSLRGESQFLRTLQLYICSSLSASWLAVHADSQTPLMLQVA